MNQEIISSPPRMRILVADDDQTIRELIAMELKHFGYDVDQAESGDDALALAMRGGHNYFALITDFDMPGMNGGQLIKAMRAEHLPIEHFILISALGERSPQIQSIFNDCRSPQIYFVPKPFYGETLTELLGKLR